jgi:hypothetical protein
MDGWMERKKEKIKQDGNLRSLDMFFGMES